MVIGLESIANKEYLGRVIIMGRLGDNDVIAYAVTGRSPPSRAREIVPNKELELGAVKTNPTKPEVLKDGIKPLLIYNCTRRYHDNLVVSNGAQSDVIVEAMDDLRSKDRYVTPAGILVKAFEKPYLVEGNEKIPLIDLTKYEPDQPNYTPRVSGVMTKDGAAMCIVKWSEEGPVKHFFEFPLTKNRGKVLATYTGQNVPKGQKIPSFEGEPFDVLLDAATPKKVAEDVYVALGPKEPGEGIISPGDDFRVGVVSIFYNRRFDSIDCWMINRTEKGE